MNLNDFTYRWETKVMFRGILQCFLLLFIMCILVCFLFCKLYVFSNLFEYHYRSEIKKLKHLGPKRGIFKSTLTTGSNKARKEVSRNVFHLPHDLNKQMTFVKEKYGWRDKETKELADYLLNKLPSHIFMDDFIRLMDEKMKQGNKKKIDETVLCHVIEESLLITTIANFTSLTKKYAHQFKEGRSSNKENYETEMVGLNNIKLPDEYTKKIGFIKERYEWESKETQELTCYLLKRFPIQLLRGDDFIKILDQKIEERNKERINELMLHQVMEESLLTKTIPAYNNIIRRYVQQFKERKLS